MSKVDESSSGSIAVWITASNTGRSPRVDPSNCTSLVFPMSEHSMQRSGISIISAVLLLAASGCHFPYGFSGGGLPTNIHTVAILPFENRTPSPNVQQEL